jgi:hypothetical protein
VRQWEQLTDWLASLGQVRHAFYATRVCRQQALS